MRIIRLVVISFIVLFLLVTGISLFIPSHVKISRAINLKADPVVIMNHLNNAVSWDQWYPGADSASLPLYASDTSRYPVGLVFKGRDTAHRHFIVITKRDSAEVTAQLINGKRDPVINVWQLINHTSSDSLTLHWYMDFHLHWYPWEKFASLLLEKSYGSAMEQGLTRFKKLVEN